MRFLLILLLPILLISCSQKSPPLDSSVSTGELQNTGMVDTGATKDPNQELIEAAVSNHTLVFKGLEPITKKVYHTSGIATKVSFRNYDANSMAISLDFLEDKKPNLRLSRVIMPDGTMDGPFWDRTGINLTQKGEYQLLFNENQMAGEPWSGIVDMTFTPLETEYPEPGVILP